MINKLSKTLKIEKKEIFVLYLNISTSNELKEKWKYSINFHAKNLFANSINGETTCIHINQTCDTKWLKKNKIF